MKIEIRHQSVRFNKSGYLKIMQGLFSDGSYLKYLVNKLTVILR